jgi:predicted CoA-substrate-specific enzyme activase
VIVAGVDAGARAIKVVLLDADSREVVASGVTDQGVDPGRRAAELLGRVRSDQGLAREHIGGTVATGYARNAIEGIDTTITEITCHARGVSHLLPGTRTVIEIGGQDSKVLHLDGRGVVRDFAMNDRCAAGSGRFLEVLASRLGLSIQALGEMTAQSRQPAPINSTCVVFAETEITGLLATGATPADIAAGVLTSIASRVATLVGSKVVTPVVLTGGVALIPGMASALQQSLGQPVSVAPDPQFTGALGAALLAAERAC